ncbi:MAG TPA: phosphate-starvation-inducible PsiE family protein [Candidatus Angelobacter sp.]
MTPTGPRDEKLRNRFDIILATGEVGIYWILAVLLCLTALVAIASAGTQLWSGLRQLGAAAQTLRVLDELLIVLMLVEILHTVRISVRSHVLVTEPFLVVGLIASIRRILVITLEASTLYKEGKWTSDSASMLFRDSMIELGLLGVLVLILVFCIILLRRNAEAPSAESQTL